MSLAQDSQPIQRGIRQGRVAQDGWKASAKVLS
jgi:hypothetical protein